MDAAAARAAVEYGDFARLLAALDCDEITSETIHGQVICAARIGARVFLVGPKEERSDGRSADLGVLMLVSEDADRARFTYIQARESILATVRVHAQVCGHHDGDTPVADSLGDVPTLNPLVELLDQPTPDYLS